MTYEEWEKSVPIVITQDTLWRVEAYRLGLFIADLSWNDVTKLMRDGRTVSIADLLYRAVGKISSNISEGYSRGTGRGRACFYEYAMGSARESRDWYHKARHVLGAAVTEHRMEIAAQIVRLSITMTSSERRLNRQVQPSRR